MKNWQARMCQAYEIASRTADRETSRSKAGYDRRIHGIDLQPGGRVLVRNLSERGGPGKLRSYWENRVYVIVKRRSDESPVYEVVPEGGGKMRVLHRNLLLPCDSLPLENSEATPQPETVRKIKVRRKDRKCLGEVQSEVPENEDFQDGELVLQFPTSLSQCQNPVCLNPEAEPFTPSVEQHGEREPQRTEEEMLEVLEERREADLGMSVVQSEISEEQASVESEDDDSLPVNSYPRREHRRPRMLTYESLGQPSVVEVAIDRLNASKESAVQRLWRPWTMLEVPS